MANVYWVGGTGTWDGATTTNWSTSSGGSGGAAVPTTADVAIFDSLSNQAGSGASYTVTRTATTAVLGIQMANPSAGTLTFAGSSALQTNTSGLTISAGVNWTNTGAFTFGATQTVTTNGVTLANNFTNTNAVMTISLGSAFTTTGTFQMALNAITLTLNNYNLTCLSLSTNAGTLKTFNFGTGIITCTGSGTVWNTSSNSLAFTGTPNVYITNSTATTTTINPGTNSRFNFYVFNGGYTFNISSNGSVGNLDFSSFTGTLSSGAAPTIYGSLTLSSGMTWNQSITAVIVFAATTTGNTITTAGKSLTNFRFSGIGGGWVLQDNLTAAGNLDLTDGTIDFNTKTVTSGATAISGGTLSIGSGSLIGTQVLGSNTLTQTGGTITATTGSVEAATFTSTTGTRAINMGSGTWTVTGTGTVWSVASAGLTMDSGTSKIVLSDNTTSAKTFAGGGVAYYNLQIGPTGTSNAIATYTITGANTFAGTISSTKTVASTITLPASTTTTVGNWTVAGRVGGLITLNSSTVGTQATLTDSNGGIISVDYLNISDSAATGATWYAGANSVNTSNNTGWIFTAPLPSGVTIGPGWSMGAGFAIF